MAAGAAFGVWFGVSRAVHDAGDYLAAREASAAAVPAAPVAELQPMPSARLPVRPRPIVIDNIFGAPDEDLLAPLGAAAVSKMKLNHGGTSLSIRVDFANGARAAFKPEQIHTQSNPRREIAAFRLDRLLSLGHVPPAKETAIAVKDLLDAADPGFRAYYAQRIADEAIARDGVLHGELSWWVPELKLAAFGRQRIDEKEGRELWTAWLQVGAKYPAQYREFLAQLSALILYDVLIDNADRWSGANTTMSPDGKLLFFMDNTLAFSIAKFGHPMNTGAMRRIQVFPKGLVGRLRTLTLEQLEATLAPAPESKLGPLLNPTEIRAILHRRDNMLRYIDQLIARHGEEAVLAFP